MPKQNKSSTKKPSASKVFGSGKSNLLRAEAAPLRYGELTAEQREAGDRAITLLQEMARMPVPEMSRNVDHPYLPEIDHARYNHVVLIDGRRGAGKSGLLVSLVKSLRDIATGSKPYTLFQPLKPENRLKAVELIVPVGLIDLQPLPEDTNLLFYLLGHLEQVVRSLEQTQGKNRGRVAQPWEDGDLHSLESRRAWRAFTRAAAFGWRGSHTERRKSLDPESFAIEVEHGELERMDVIRRFRAFVDALANDYRDDKNWDSNSLPFFVISIDDADMNPKRSGELLDLVRKLWHPRLGFLLTGDTELFLTMLGVGFRGDLKTKKAEKARLLAYDVYNKTIPHRQRCGLPPIPPDERLRYPLPSRNRPRPHESLNETLRKFSFQTHKKETEKTGGATPESDNETNVHLGRQEISSQSAETDIPPSAFRGLSSLEDLFREGQHFSEALPDRVRSILSLQHELDDIQFLNGEFAKAADSLPRAIHRIWEHALEAALAPANEVSRLHQIVRLVHLDTGRGLICDSLPIKVKAQSYHVESRQLNPSWVARLSAIRQLDFVLPSAGKKTSFPFPPRLSSAFLVAHEVAQTDDRGVLVGSGAKRVARKAPFVNVVWNSGLYGRLEFAWPVPEWSSYLDLLRFNKGWEKYLDEFRKAENGEDALDQLAWYFLSLVVSVGTYSEVRLWKQDVKVQKTRLEGDWDQLSREMKKLTQVQGPERAELMADWVNEQLFFFATPEAGTSEEFSEKLLEVLQAVLRAKSLRGVVERFEDLRRERLIGARSRPFFYSDEEAERWEKRQADSIRQIDAIFKGHPWVELGSKPTTDGDPKNQKTRPPEPGNT